MNELEWLMTVHEDKMKNIRERGVKVVTQHENITVTGYIFEERFYIDDVEKKDHDDA